MALLGPQKMKSASKRCRVVKKKLITILKMWSHHLTISQDKLKRSESCRSGRTPTYLNPYLNPSLHLRTLSTYVSCSKPPTVINISAGSLWDMALFCSFREGTYSLVPVKRRRKRPLQSKRASCVLP